MKKSSFDCLFDADLNANYPESGRKIFTVEDAIAIEKAESLEE